MTEYTLEESQDWYNNLPGKRTSAAMVIRKNDTVLMVKANYKTHWTFPGGVVDPKESPLDAAVRETHEEVGIDFSDDIVRYITVTYIPEMHGFKDRIHFFFEAPVYNDQPITLQANEIDEYDWVPLDQIAERAENRGSYVEIQRMLVTGNEQPYVNVNKEFK